jgi:FtsP/CotA-like multicopper oxidase with cupredoxin domain
MKMKNTILKTRLLLAPMLAMAFTAAAHAAAPGITGATSFRLTAQSADLTQPDGAAVYSWGYGCNGTPDGFAPAAISSTFCNTMQVPGPTLIVTEGQTVTVTLTNSLPTAAGNTSILFPGFQMQSFTDGAAGLLTQEAVPGGTVTYRFTALSPGTRAYYSGTQGDLQVEMGLYGAIIVLPSSVPATCNSGLAASNLTAQAHWGESDFRLAHAAYDHATTCYDREYLFQFSEMDADIHRQALAQVNALGNCAVTDPACRLEVATEPYIPDYFMINGRSMPDDMDPNYATQ